MLTISVFSDFTVKIINVDDSSQKLAFEHEAPLLCVCMNPQETLFVSFYFCIFMQTNMACVHL